MGFLAIIDEHQYIIAASISTISSASVAGSIALFRADMWGKYYNRLIFYIFVGNFFSSLAFAIGEQRSATFGCFFQGFFSNYFVLSSILWTTIISYLLYDIVQCSKKLGESYYHHLFSWGISLVVSVFPLTTEKISQFNAENTRDFCGLNKAGGSPKWTEDFWGIVFNVAIWISTVFIWIFLIRIFRIVRMNKSALSSKYIKKALKKLFGFPIVIIICWSLQSFLNISDLFSFDIPDDAFVASYFLILLQGTCNAVIFWTTNKEVRRLWHELVFSVRLSRGSESTQSKSSNTSIDNPIRTSLVSMSANTGSVSVERADKNICRETNASERIDSV